MVVVLAHYLHSTGQVCASGVCVCVCGVCVCGVCVCVCVRARVCVWYMYICTYSHTVPCTYVYKYNFCTVNAVT